MRHGLKLLYASIFLALPLAASAEAPDFSGVWQQQEGDAPIYFLVHQQGENLILIRPNDIIPFAAGKLANDVTGTLVQDFKTNDGVKGHVLDGAYSGTLQQNNGTYSVNFKRIKAATPGYSTFYYGLQFKSNDTAELWQHCDCVSNSAHDFELHPILVRIAK